jgi:hypothetical protein
MTNVTNKINASESHLMRHLVVLGLLKVYLSQPAIFCGGKIGNRNAPGTVRAVRRVRKRAELQF